MNSEKFSLYRLNTIRALFRTEGMQLSIEELETLLDVPRSVIRKDIEMLYSNQELITTFSTQEEEEEDADNFVKDLRAGKKDEMMLESSIQERRNSSQAPRCLWLPLTAMEKERLDAFEAEMSGKEEVKENWMRKRYVVKPLYNQSRVNMQVKLDEMRKIIQEQTAIQIRYNGKNYRILPLQLLHNALEDWYYVVTIVHGKLKFFRLDTIRRWEPIKEKIEIEDRSPLEQLPMMWGPEPGKPFHVRIKVLDEGDVKRKVKRDLAFRNFTPVQEGSDLYYEGEVIGRNNFKSWLRSYGSSVLVTEPESLKREMIASAKRKLEYYQK